MKLLIVFSALFAVAMCASVLERGKVDNTGADAYHWGLKTSDGKSVVEEGHLNNVGSDHESLTVKGQYSYTGPDGVVYTVSYCYNNC